MDKTQIIQATAGTGALVNPVWITMLPVVWQAFVAFLGGILLIMMILNKWTEYQLHKKELNKYEKD